MQAAPQSQLSHSPARLRNYHGTKQQAMRQQVTPAPAWRSANSVMKEVDSKILIGALPTDVKEHEVHDLFQKTVGPVKDCFLIYNSAGGSKGMAIVTFQRPGDAVIARTKYDGKIVDGRRKLQIELVVSDEIVKAPPSFATPSLLNRIAPKAPEGSRDNEVVWTPPAPQNPTAPRRPSVTHTVPIQRARRMKGPRRTKKSLAQLDREMEDYRAAALATENVSDHTHTHSIV